MKTEQKRPWLVDVPVSLMVWVRPELQKQGFAVIRAARPRKLYLISDGPRTPEERRLLEQSRALVEQVDWDCEVYRLYREENQGLYAMCAQGEKFVFDREDRCIILEDDVVPDVTFFAFCAELLERYQNDLRVQAVCGMNILGSYAEPSADYFFSRGGAIWGYALWKRTYEACYDRALCKDAYALRRCKENAARDPYGFERQLSAYADGTLYGGGEPTGSEFYMGVQRYAQEQLNIVASQNLVHYLGFSAHAAHAAEKRRMPKGLQCLCDVPVFPCSFPLRHPAYVVRDVHYEALVNRMMGWGHPLVQLWRKLASMTRTLAFGSKSEIFAKIRGKLGAKQPKKEEKV